MRGGLRFLVTCLLLAESVACADDSELLFLGSQQPARITIDVQIGDQRLRDLWDENFVALVSFYDRDGNGKLSEAEAARLPSKLALREVLSAGFTPTIGEAPAWKELDKNGDGVAEAAEIAGYYRSQDLGGPQIGAGLMSHTAQLNAALLKMLDANSDGAVAASELKNAAAALDRFDRNEDEVVGAGELVAGLLYPGGAGSHLLRPPHAERPQSAFAGSFGAVVLPQSRDDAFWVEAVAKRLAGEGKSSIAANELAQQRAAAADFQVQIKFSAATGEEGAKATPVLTLAGTKSAKAMSSLTLTKPGLLLIVCGDPGKLPEFAPAYQERLQSRFSDADTNDDNALDSAEIDKAGASNWPAILAAADRNGDEKLSEAEFQAWSAFQAKLAAGQVMFTLLDGGQGLFELLDANHDGALSVRELKTAHDTVAEAGALHGNMLDLQKLPRTFLLTASRGYPQSVLGTIERTGPAWFLAMDRNRDGEVSQREFTGPPTAFTRLDADGDDRISATEAAK